MKIACILVFVLGKGNKFLNKLDIWIKRSPGWTTQYFFFHKERNEKLNAQTIQQNQFRFCCFVYTCRKKQKKEYLWVMRANESDEVNCAFFAYIYSIALAQTDQKWF